MKNPWTKNNPWMSLWLSGAHAVAGTARSRATAASKRQAATLIRQGTKQMMSVWSGVLLASPPKKKKKRR